MSRNTSLKSSKKIPRKPARTVTAQSTRISRAQQSIARRIVKEPVWLWVLIGLLVFFVVWYVWAWLNPSVAGFPADLIYP